jgi:hypothetical protein
MCKYVYSVYLHTCLRTIMISTVVVHFCRIIPIWRCQEPKWPEIGCTLRCHQTWLAGKSLTNGNVKLKSIYKKRDFPLPCLITLLRVTSMTSSGHAVTGSSFQKSKLLRNWGDSSSSRPQIMNNIYICNIILSYIISYYVILYCIILL